MRSQSFILVSRFSSEEGLGQGPLEAILRARHIRWKSDRFRLREGHKAFDMEHAATGRSDGREPH